MLLRALLCCPESKTKAVVVRVLTDLEIAVEHCEQVSDASNRVTLQKYDAIIVDCDDAKSILLMHAARESACNKSSLIAAMIDPKSSAKTTFGDGASLVLYKPISMERARTSLRAARGLMQRERRAILRIPVQGLTSITSEQQPLAQAIVVDLSEAGMAIRCAEPLNAKGPLSIRLTLPDDTQQIRVTGEVAWQDRTGRFGIRFLDTSQISRRALKEWLSAHGRAGESNSYALGRSATSQ